ncbi:hypothetical protein D3C81_2062010 [compost metagenome]
MTKNLVSQTSISWALPEECVAAYDQGREATCHAAKDHAVHPRNWDYSFNVD